MAKQDWKNPAAFFAIVYPRLRELAFQHGYALGIHGTLGRDLDLIAVPWVQDAESHDKLAEAIRIEIGGFDEQRLYFRKTPEPKPHGRIAYSFYLTENDAKRHTLPYIDLSIMPLVGDVK